ncbi:hypothetical protein KC19_VG072200 [Ceratodon purpureus]|uniref:Uncharacterized protein n=1 Tax=Ceratodon purpureus TaxID=3225 RepID=A0A8T0HNA1_CERPU|nr:hypothetical protein KC19_VG072200 [Ceratodon purpureus]
MLSSCTACVLSSKYRAQQDMCSQIQRGLLPWHFNFRVLKGAPMTPLSTVGILIRMQTMSITYLLVSYELLNTYLIVPHIQCLILLCIRPIYSYASSNPSSRKAPILSYFLCRANDVL